MHKRTIITVFSIAILVIGGGIAAIILNNHYITERANAAAAAERQKAKDAQEQALLSKTATELGQSNCLKAADNAYNDFVKANATSTVTQSDGQVLYSMPQTKWDYVSNQRQEAYSNCYEEYPSK